MPWMIVLAAYFAVGFTLIFVGPAARARRREQIKWEWHPARRQWIQKILTLLITFGTFAFWPVFTVWAKENCMTGLRPFRFGILTHCPMKPTYKLGHSCHGSIRKASADGFRNWTV